jgi:hypothetical protein
MPAHSARAGERGSRPLGGGVCCLGGRGESFTSNRCSRCREVLAGEMYKSNQNYYEPLLNTCMKPGQGKLPNAQCWTRNAYTTTPGPGN